MGVVGGHTIDSLDLGSSGVDLLGEELGDVVMGANGRSGNADARTDKRKAVTGVRVRGVRGDEEGGFVLMAKEAVRVAKAIVVATKLCDSSIEGLPVTRIVRWWYEGDEVVGKGTKVPVRVEVREGFVETDMGRDTEGHATEDTAHTRAFLGPHDVNVCLFVFGEDVKYEGVVGVVCVDRADSLRPELRDSVKHGLSFLGIKAVDAVVGG